MRKYLLVAFATILCLVVGAQISGDSLTATPNPFINRTLLKYSFANADTVNIFIVSTTGQIVLSPVTNSVMAAGSYQDSLIMDSYPPGIYFVTLKLGSRTARVMKIVKLNPTGLNEVKENCRVNVFPNPFKNELTVEFCFPQAAMNLALYNSLGQLVYSQADREPWQAMDFGYLEKGLYFLHAWGTTGSEVLKIIKE